MFPVSAVDDTWVHFMSKTVNNNHTKQSGFDFLDICDL
jgi:hypothetical protein